MKKILVLLAIFFMSATFISAAEQAKQPNERPSVNDIKVQREKAFEKRLELTDEQKIKAREIRIKGHEAIKPIVEQIIAKKQEAKMVKMSRIAVQVQEERLNAIDAELKVLEKKAHDIRKANMKEFESILTKEQKRTLKQMKKEGRQKYHSAHPMSMPRMISPQAFGVKTPAQTK